MNHFTVCTIYKALNIILLQKSYFVSPMLKYSHVLLIGFQIFNFNLTNLKLILRQLANIEYFIIFNYDNNPLSGYSCIFPHYSYE